MLFTEYSYLFFAFYSVHLLKPPNNLMGRYYEHPHFTAKGLKQNENQCLAQVTRAARLQHPPDWHHAASQEERVERAHVH